MTMKSSVACPLLVRKGNATTNRALVFLLLVSWLLASCQSQSRQELMSQGKQLSDQGNFKGAIVVYKNILEKFPDDAAATLGLTEAYLRSGKTEQAVSELTRAARLAGDTPDLNLLTASVRNAEGKPDLALEVLQPLLAAQSVPAEVFEQAGLAYLYKKHFDQAQAHYEKALAANPRLERSRLGLAESLIQQHRPEQAQVQLRELLKISPKNRDALYMVVELEILKNDEDAIIETYRKLAQYYPFDLRARYSEAFLRLSRKKDYTFAQTTADALIKQFGKAPEGYKLNGLCLLEKGNNEQAVVELLSANKLRPDIDTNMLLAQAYLGLGDLDTSANHLQAVLSRNPSLIPPRRMLASIYMRQKRWDEAIEETQKLLQRAPSDDMGERLLGDALVAKQEFDKALDIFSRLSEQEGQPPVVYLKKGLLQSMKGDDIAAEQELRKAVDLGGKHLEPRIYLAAFLASKKRVDDAVAVLAEGQETGAMAALGRNAMAKLRLRQGQLDKSLELLEEAKHIDPLVLASYYNLAAIHIAKGELQQATEEFEAVLAIKKDEQRALSGAAACREALGDTDGARALLENAASTFSPQPSLELAQFHIRRSDSGKALAVLEKTLTVTPNFIPALMLKSQVLAAQGATDTALNTLDRLETLNQRQGLLEKAKFYLSQQMSDKALEVAGKLRDINPKSGDYYLPLADIQKFAGKLELAKQTLEHADKEDPGNYRVLTALADIHARQQDLAGALLLTDKAMAAGIAPAEGHATKGLLYQRAGDQQAALQNYQQALRFKDDMPLALNNLAMIYADQKGEEARALELALHACTVQPNNPQLLDTLGYTLIKNGRFKDALSVLERANKIMPRDKDIEQHLNMAREHTQGNES